VASWLTFAGNPPHGTRMGGHCLLGDAPYFVYYSPTSILLTSPTYILHTHIHTTVAVLKCLASCQIRKQSSNSRALCILVADTYVQTSQKLASLLTTKAQSSSLPTPSNRTPEPLKSPPPNPNSKKDLNTEDNSNNNNKKRVTGSSEYNTCRRGYALVWGF